MAAGDPVAERGQVLVAIQNNRRDLDIAQEQHWYRIPVESANKWLRNRWPPEWIAFYQTKTFGSDAFAVNYYAQVTEIREVCRHDLFPDEAAGQKSGRRYYQVFFDHLRRLQTPITSRRRRRIIFIPTTWRKFQDAFEINDLYDDSPLEDLLWAQFKRLNLYAERQEFVEVDKRSYSIDFAIYCANGKIAVETDGDSYHANPAKAAEDNLRNNDLESVGWNVLRFTTDQIREQMTDYCVPSVVKTVNVMGGLDEGGVLPRKINSGPSRQFDLFGHS